jgi:CP family cyanate transporter-like MFS transporter
VVPVVAVVALLLIALSLRLPITSVGSSLTLLRQDLRLSAGSASLLTTLPVICFAVFGAMGGWLARRLGPVAAMTAAVGVLCVGLVVRVVDGEAGLLLGTALACMGIAVANVVLPALAKVFPARYAGRLTGAYSAVISAGAALGAAFSVPLAAMWGGWRAGLGLWVLLAVAALLLWWRAAPGMPRGSAPAAGGGRIRLVLRSPQAWGLALLFGTQSSLAYVVMGWLPVILSDAGMPVAQAGLLLALNVAVSVPVYFIVPVLAARRRSQAVLGVVLTLFAAAGFAGLLVAPVTLPWLWSALIGVGNGVFPLVLVLFTLRSPDPATAADVSAMGQSIGYLLAASLPAAVGLLRYATGSWTVPLLAVLGVCAVQLVASVWAGSPGLVQEAGSADGRLRQSAEAAPGA